MAVTWMTGFEAQAVGVDNITLTGTAAYSTAEARTGAASLRCNPASGANGAASIGTSAEFIHFGLYVASLPSVARYIFGTVTGTGIKLNPSGTLSYMDTSTTLFTTTTTLTTGQWYWIGIRLTVVPDLILLQINGADEGGAQTSAGSSWSGHLGPVGGEASAIDVYFDDVIMDSAAFLAPSKVSLLLPISDNLRDALWTGGAGGTTNLFDAVNNTPPIGTATETNLTQIEHAGGGGAGGDVYRANMTTYTTAGVGASDTIIALQGLTVWGEDIATGTKLLSYHGLSNPVWTGENSVDVSTGHGSGAVGTYSATGAADGWNERRSVIKTTGLTIGVNITLGTSPGMYMVRPETASRVASVCFMGMVIAWTPAAVAYVSPRRPYPPLLAQ